MNGSIIRPSESGARLDRRRAVLRTLRRRQAFDRRRQVVALRTAGLLRSVAEHATDHRHQE